MAPDSQKERKNQETLVASNQNSVNDATQRNKVEQQRNTNLNSAKNDNTQLTKTETRKLREKHLGPNIELFFGEDPLKIVRGAGQYVYDENNVKYLDCNSNVNHVGHSHPKVAEAVYKQMLTLNVNSRFLDDNLSIYAQRLSGKFPDGLDICYFANSGSESNDLAMQMSRAYHDGKRQHILCLEMGYHGHLQSTMKMSGYKRKNNKLPYGFADLGKDDWVRFLSLPDPIRGKYAHLQSEQEQCDAYIIEAERIVAEDKDDSGECQIAALIIESIPSCAGQVMFPQHYLKRLFTLMRNEDIICIADEVQTGFGRIGENFWAFEMHDAVPDMVTVGKPIANGYPLSALVTTEKIATAFCKGKRTYFNTYGGAPVGMAAGLATLEVIENEKLQDNAKITGRYLKEQLLKLKSRHWMMADVRGSGLFVGFELIKDESTLEPGTEETALLQMRLMKEDRVLVNTDGKFESVVKFKPPMCFNKADADWACKAIDRVLGEIEQDVLSQRKKANVENS